VGEESERGSPVVAEMREHFDAEIEGDDAVARLNVWRGLAGVAEAQGDLTSFLQLLQKRP